ncbi:DNA integrity scanning protein DisA nucleotide-binding domain protein [Pectobacterium aroidearum]|uniref:diadenylate cyclase n=1 Tax=Pectobacterium aroidearum TaxID=1201031 RepID=UPI0015F069E4|nr:diadenylate cyclase [Pectobacterium aroidearum]MBA5235470.1 DNA integrity scanning protein DisA nucleotide-binding domain protein [Pectobacterium aroidearum]
MASNIIYLFMWGYQAIYRIHIQILARDVLKKLGAPTDADVLLVGARSPNSKNVNPVCVEPEDGKWRLSLFEGLLGSVESTYQSHQLQSVFFGDEPSMRDKPEWIRRDSVRTSVSKALEAFDTEHNVTSFCGEVRRVDDYYVTPVIQIPNITFVQFPPLLTKPVDKGQQGSGFRSLIHAAMYAILHEATEELHNPDPGRFTYNSMRDAEEIVRIAAKNFLHTPGLSIEQRYNNTDLFDALNLVSSLMYEGAKGIGQLILVDPEDDAVEFLAKFIEPVPFREPRWVRKVLQMAAAGVGIIANSQYIYGLGRLKESYDPSAQNAFTVNFIDHYHWELYCGGQALLRSHYAVPKLPQEPFDKAAFLANYARLFPLSSQESGLYLWSLLLTQASQEHGSMIVVAEDAASEAHRLNKQGTNIVPIRLTESLLRSVSGIDGTILLDPAGFCHAIGIILDGEATEQCTPSRGSRYNSGVRYVLTGSSSRLAIVVSDDRTVDIIPPIKRLCSRSKIDQCISTLEKSTLDNYHDSRNWLTDHRFYINAEQCARINAVLDRLDAVPKEVGLIYSETKRFEADPKMDESYLID